MPNCPPVHHTVIAAHGGGREAILNSIAIHGPLVCIIRAIEIGSVAGGQKAPGPDIDRVAPENCAAASSTCTELFPFGGLPSYSVLNMKLT